MAVVVSILGAIEDAVAVAVAVVRAGAQHVDLVHIRQPVAILIGPVPWTLWLGQFVHRTAIPPPIKSVAEPVAIGVGRLGVGPPDRFFVVGQTVSVGIDPTSSRTLHQLDVVGGSVVVRVGLRRARAEDQQFVDVGYVIPIDVGSTLLWVGDGRRVVVWVEDTVTVHVRIVRIGPIGELSRVAPAITVRVRPQWVSHVDLDLSKLVDCVGDRRVGAQEPHLEQIVHAIAIGVGFGRVRVDLVVVDVRIPLLAVGQTIAIGVDVVRVRTDRDLMAVTQPVSIGVAVQRIEPKSNLLAVPEAVPVGVSHAGVGTDAHLLAVGQPIAVGVGIFRIGLVLQYLVDVAEPIAVAVLRTHGSTPIIVRALGAVSPIVKVTGTWRIGEIPEVANRRPSAQQGR